MAMGICKPQSIIHDSSSERIRVHCVDTTAIHVRTWPAEGMFFLTKSCKAHYCYTLRVSTVELWRFVLPFKKQKQEKKCKKRNCLSSQAYSKC